MGSGLCTRNAKKFYPLADYMSTSKTVGVILAAGMSTRMGKNKLLLPFKGVPLLQHVINAARGSRLAQLALVLPAYEDAQEMLNILDVSDCKLLYNPLRHLGQAESLKLGIEHFVLGSSPDVQGAMIFLGDQPFLTAQTVNLLIAQAQPQSWVIPQQVNKNGEYGQRGNPVIIPSQEFSRVLQLEGDTGARTLLQSTLFPKNFVEIEEDAPFVDIDTPEEYALLNTLKGD